MEMLVSFLNDKIVHTLLPFVGFLGILIFVHELGHFLVARFCGVRVEVFSLGFGKKIFQRKRGDTNYCISIFPLGGYVKMYGDQPTADVPDELKSVSFTHKNVWQRIAIVLAGPLMNFIFAIFLYSLISMIGENIHVARIGDVIKNSPAAQSGIQSGDQIVAVNDETVLTWDEMQKQLNSYQDKEVSLSILRGNVTKELSQSDTAKSVVKVKVSSKDNPNILSLSDRIGEISGLTPYSRGTFVGITKGSPLATFGVKLGDQIVAIGSGKGEQLTKISFWRDFETILKATPITEALVLEFSKKGSENLPPETYKVTLAGSAFFKEYSTQALGLESSELYLDKVVPDSPADKAGLNSNDRILSINSVEINSWEDVLNQIKSFDGKGELKMIVRRDDQVLNLSVTPKMSSMSGAYGQEEQRFTIGIAPYVNSGPIEVGQFRTNNPFVAVYRGTLKTIEYSEMIGLSLVRLLQAKISTKNIGGIISVGQAASDTARLGIMAFMQMMALFSINLFILNLLPIPLLDGGHMVFYTLEVIKGKPISLRKMEIAQQVGIVILVSLMVFGFVNDITRIFMK